jgi:amino-acid N-acetyltransferase
LDLQQPPFKDLTMDDINLRLIEAENETRTSVIELLRENNLPISDLDENKQLFALLNGEELVGTGGLELFEDCALVRSLSVKKDLRGSGLGAIINSGLEKIAKQKGVDCLYLLTETAEDFFKRQHYQVVSREAVPDPIRSTSEFSSLCPSSAIVMKKELH